MISAIPSPLTSPASLTENPRSSCELIPFIIKLLEPSRIDIGTSGHPCPKNTEG